MDNAVKAESLTFKKVVHKDQWTAKSFPITKKADHREFHTLGLYQKDKDGHEHFVLEIEPELFKQIVMDFVLSQIRN